MEGVWMIMEVDGKWEGNGGQEGGEGRVGTGENGWRYNEKYSNVYKK